MENPGAYSSFLIFWVGWGILMLLGGVWLFHWSVTSGQYGEAKRASMLPLDDVDLEAAARKRGGLGHLIFALSICVVVLCIISLGGWMALHAPPDPPR